MLDHLCITIKNLEVSKSFYTTVLEPLGYGVVAEYGKSVGFGKDGKPSFWIGEDKPGAYWNDDHAAGSAPIHIAFVATDREQVNTFHRVGVAAGATDYGEPGLRPLYHDNYYGSFLIDPDGNNIEAVCHH